MRPQHPILEQNRERRSYSEQSVSPKESRKPQEGKLDASRQVLERDPGSVSRDSGPSRTLQLHGLIMLAVIGGPDILSRSLRWLQ